METAETSQTVPTGETAECTCMTQPAMPVPEASLVLGPSKEYFYAGLREGRFPGVRFGRARGLPRAFVKSFITEVIELGLPISFEEFAAAWIAERSEVAS